MFGHLIGNERAKQQLTKLLSGRRVPNSLLFAGPDGIGKKAFAFELARSFVCSAVAENLACGMCSSCLRVDVIVPPKAEKGEEYEKVFFGSHSDIGLVSPYKRNIRVGSIRALEQEAHFRPFEARSRVFILDDADRMNDAASNALLKTLEEPPQSTYIILVSSSPDKLLQTIRSRSQIIRFAPVPTNEIERMLIDRHGFSEADAILASRASAGSVSNAIKFDSEQFRTARSQMLELIEHGSARNGMADMLMIGEQLNDAKNKDRFEENLSVLESLARDVWLLATGAEIEQITNLDIAERLIQIADHIDANRPAAWLERIESMRQNFAVNINRKIATDDLVIKMAA